VHEGADRRKPTRAAAQSVRRKRAALHKKGVLSLNLREWCMEFLDIYKKPFIKVGTYERYKCTFKHIPAIELDELSPSELQKIINNMSYEGYSLTTIKHVKIIIVQALRRAQRLGMYPMYDLTIDMPKSRKTKISAFSDSDQQLIIKNAHRSFYGDLFLSLMYSGCRVGELIALEWSDIDFRNNILNINKTDWHGNIQSPKTDESIRTVPMSEELRRIMLNLYKIGCKGRVFRSTIGTVVNYRSLLDSWHRFQVSIGINPIVGLHVLRHTFATNGLRAGINYKTLSRILGHASVAVTMDIYCDVSENDKQSAIHKLSEYLRSRA
jgi:integrase